MKRVAAIDFLRALAIMGMVVSGQMLWNAELPAAMFHAQLPPPTFAFNPEVAGITWVDLVFPFFLFSMGAAMPMALRRREEQGASWGSIAGSALHRFLWLAAFAIILGNTRMGRLSDESNVVAALMTLWVWVLFFVMFVRIPQFDKRKNQGLNWGGFALLVLTTWLYKPLFGVDVSIERSDIIILILASMALFGTLLWWLTRNHLVARLLLIAGVAALKLSSQVEGSWCAAVWAYSPAAWLIRFEFLKYLCIVLSGTIAGDLIHRYRSATAGQKHEAALLKEASAVDVAPSVARLTGPVPGFVAVLIAWVGVLMWGLFVRQVGVAVLFSLILGTVAWLLVQRFKGADAPLMRQLYLLSAALLAIGLLVEPLEGGIKKDPATLGFFFVTSALALFFLMGALAVEVRYGFRFRALEACGANPMFAYTASAYLITPIATLTSLSVLIERFAALTPWCGFLRGLLFACLVVAVTYPLTRKNYYWKS